MIELFEKSMNTLELPRVLDMLAGEAVTDEGKELCRAARPSDDPAEVHQPALRGFRHAGQAGHA